MKRVSILSVAGFGLLVAGCDMSPGPSPVPVTSTAAHLPNSCPAIFVVRPGDNVYSVAVRCGLSVRELIEANNLQPPYALVPGSSLHMPGSVGEIIVGRGDTLHGLAYKNHVDFNALAVANHKSPPYVIRLGEHLRLPGAFGTSPAAPPAAAAKGAVVESQPLPPPPPPKPKNSAASGSADPLPSQALAPQIASAKAPPPVSQPSVPPPPVKPNASASSPAAPAAAVPTVFNGFVWPVKGEILVGFGPKAAKGQNNDGINIAAAKGTPILAAEAGVVAYVGNELKGFGNLVLIKHADGWVSAYAHADEVLVKKGQSIAKGQEIGTVGQTGSVTQSQLHFELRHQGEVVDPEEYLPG